MGVQSLHHLPSPGQGADWVVGLSPRVEASGPAESQALQEQVETLQGLLGQLQQQVAPWARV